MQVLIYIFSIWSNITKHNGNIICMYNRRHREEDTYKRPFRYRAELHLSGCWLSGSPIKRIGWAIRVICNKINYIPQDYLYY